MDDGLDNLAGIVDKKLKDNKIDKSRNKQTAIHIGYYKLMKKYCVMNDMKLIDLNDMIYQDLLDKGFFDDVKNL